MRPLVCPDSAPSIFHTAQSRRDGVYREVVGGRGHFVGSLHAQGAVSPFVSDYEIGAIQQPRPGNRQGHALRESPQPNSWHKGFRPWRAIAGSSVLARLQPFAGSHTTAGCSSSIRSRNSTRGMRHVTIPEGDEGMIEEDEFHAAVSTPRWLSTGEVRDVPPAPVAQRRPRHCGDRVARVRTRTACCGLARYAECTDETRRRPLVLWCRKPHEGIAGRIPQLPIAAAQLLGHSPPRARVPHRTPSALCSDRQLGGNALPARTHEVSRFVGHRTVRSSSLRGDGDPVRPASGRARRSRR